LVGNVFDMQFVNGRASDLTADGILISKARADSDKLAMGSIINVTLIDGKTRPLTVQGIYKKRELAGAYTISNALYTASGADTLHFAVYATKAPGVSDPVARAAISKVVTAYPTGKLLSRSEYINQQAKQLNQFVNLIYGLLALAIIIAVFGIANTLSLSVYERTRELGLLRAVGAFRSQVRSSIRWESVITALLGTVQGIVVGILLGYAIIFALRDQGKLLFTLPVVSLLVVVVVLAILAGILAAVRPARRAARLDILRAIARH
jgi:putative ABC transport system permease protein